MRKLAPILLVLAALIGGTVFLRPGNINPLLDASIAPRGSAMAKASVSVDTRRLRVQPAEVPSIIS